MSGGDWLSHYGDKPGTGILQVQGRQGRRIHLLVARQRRSSPRSPTSSNGGEPEGDRLRRQARRVHDLRQARPPLPRLGEGRQGRPSPQGENTITFTFHSDIANHGGIDCFCFTASPSPPRGVNKPTVKSDATPRPGRATGSRWCSTTTPFSRQVGDRHVEVHRGPGRQVRLPEARRRRPAVREGDRPGPVLGLRRQPAGRQVHPRAAHPAGAATSARTASTWSASTPSTTRSGLLRERHSSTPKRLDDFDWWCAELKKNGIYMTGRSSTATQIGPDDGYDPELFNELEVVDGKQDLRSTYGLVNVEPKLQDLQFKLPQGPAAPQEPLHRPAAGRRPGAGGAGVPERGLRLLLLPAERPAAGKKWPLHSQRLRQKFFALGEGRSTGPRPR